MPDPLHGFCPRCGAWSIPAVGQPLCQVLLRALALQNQEPGPGTEMGQSPRGLRVALV